VHLHVINGEYDSRQILSDKYLALEFERHEKKREREGKSRVLDTYNGQKYIVSDLSPNVPEREDLTISLRETDYFTVMKALPGILKSPQKRCKYGHLDPSLNRVPNSFGNHFLALFSDNQVLAIHRDRGLDYHGNTWSFSGEEQCFPTDLTKSDNTRTKHYLLRTAVEEVFPLGTSTDEEQLLQRIELVEPYTHSMRVWSVILEEPSMSSGIFSVMEFALTRSEYIELCDDLLRRRLGRRSGEGKYYTVAMPDIVKVLEGETVFGNPLYGTQSMKVSARQFHPTSRYRLSRLLGVIHPDQPSKH
jgi:hypothetical protein